MKRILTYLLCFCFGISFSQNKQIDSLKAILKTAGQTSVRVDALSELSQIIRDLNPDTALILGNQALLLAQKVNYKLGEAWAEFRLGRVYDFQRNTMLALFHYNKALLVAELVQRLKRASDSNSAKRLKGKVLGNIAVMYYYKADYDKALQYHLISLRHVMEIGDKHQLGKILINIGNIYKMKGDFPMTLENYLRGLKLLEETRDTLMIGRTLGNIAIVYKDLEDLPKATDFCLKALKLSKPHGDKLQTGLTLALMGGICYEKGDYSKALEYYFNSLEYSEEVKNLRTVGESYGNISSVYLKQSLDPKNSKAKADSLCELALTYAMKGLSISEELGDKQQAGVIVGNIGSIYTMLGKYTEAELNLKKALAISIEIDVMDNQMYSNKFLSTLYERTNRPALALEHYKRHIALRDTIFSQENNKKLMRTEMDHEYEKKKAVADAEHKAQMENQKLMADEKEKKQNIVIFSVLVGLVLVMIFVGFIFRSLRITNKQKQIIELKNKETLEQKREIEEKQKEILDSIKYARRIQTALITNEHYIKQNISRLRE